MFSKLSGRTKTQEIEKPQSFASQLAEATKLFTDAVSKLKNISSGVSKKMEENDAKIKSLSVEVISRPIWNSKYGTGVGKTDIVFLFGTQKQDGIMQEIFMTVPLFRPLTAKV